MARFTGDWKPGDPLPTFPHPPRRDNRVERITATREEHAKAIGKPGVDLIRQIGEVFETTTKWDGER
jgi:hypothetical protein